MKKLPVFLVIFVIICSSFPLQYANAETTADFSYSGSFDIDGFLQEFSETYYDRTTTSSEKEREAALYIETYFRQFDLKTKALEQGSSDGDYLQNFNYNGITSNNVIGVKPAQSPTNQNVIIGAHYDNVYSYETTNPYTRLNYSTESHGAYDNGSGIAVMLSIADSLKNVNLPFNVTFVAFGAEEQGMYGSMSYVENMTYSQKENTLLMVNLDSISAGDYLYLFCKDWQTEHDSYLRERATELNIPLKSLPFNKKYTSDPFGDGYYSHLAYYSDNYFFVKENINTAFFMSMNWDSKIKAGVVESDNNIDIMHTYNDTYEKLKELYPQTYLLYMQYVSELLTQSLQRTDFVSAMIDSQTNTNNYTFIMDEKYLTVGTFILWFALVVFAYFYYVKLKKISEKSIKEYMEDPENVKKMDVLLKGFKNFPPFNNNIQYPPNTYKPKKGEKKFSVFGEEYEDKEDEDKTKDDDSKTKDNDNDKK